MSSLHATSSFSLQGIYPVT